MVLVKRALLSCHDKSGLDLFAKELAALGVELVASGGTADSLAKQGLRVTTVERFAGITEQLDGRVKTLHPKIHAGILARRDDPTHLASVGPDSLIDLVVVNLYPFEQTVQCAGVSVSEAVEQIDIGGVALLRAAAKNFAHVLVVSQPSQYVTVLQALRQGRGQVPVSFSRQLAAEAFALTTAYDQHIAAFLLAEAGSEPFAQTLALSVHKRQALRYGENPHQRGAWYVPSGTGAWGLGTVRQWQGKELSYNNVLDLDAAVRCLLDISDTACTIIKHHSLCGMACASTPVEAYDRAYACDAESAFGGIVGCNRPIDVALAERLTATFLEVVVAPSVASEVLAIFAKKPNLRIVTLQWPTQCSEVLEWRQLLGSWMLQEPDTTRDDVRAAKVVTARAPSERERQDLAFAWTAAKHVRSNGIVIAREGATVGIGQGQPSRVGSVRLALDKAGARSRETVAASDGFFPFADGVDLLARGGITAIIQPGGSLRDAEVVAAADRAGLAMLITSQRHFRH